MSLLSAVIAHVDVPAQEGGPANLNSAHGTMLLPRHGRTVDLPILRAVLPEDIGHFRRRPTHRNSGGSGRLDSCSKGL